MDLFARDLIHRTHVHFVCISFGQGLSNDGNHQHILVKLGTEFKWDLSKCMIIRRKCVYIRHVVLAGLCIILMKISSTNIFITQLQLGVLFHMLIQRPNAIYVVESEYFHP